MNKKESTRMKLKYVLFLLLIAVTFCFALRVSNERRLGKDYIFIYKYFKNQSFLFSVLRIAPPLLKIYDKDELFKNERLEVNEYDFGGRRIVLLENVEGFKVLYPHYNEQFLEQKQQFIDGKTEKLPPDSSMVLVDIKYLNLWLKEMSVCDRKGAINIFLELVHSNVGRVLSSKSEIDNLAKESTEYDSLNFSNLDSLNFSEYTYFYDGYSDISRYSVKFDTIECKITDITF